MKPRTWIVFALIVAAVSGAAYWTFFKNKAPLYRFDTVTADKGPIVAKVTATGTLSALVTVTVGSQVSGRIAKINVDFNSPVKKGQVIAKIDPQLFVATIEQARANYMQAEAMVEKAKFAWRDSVRQFERDKALRAENLVAQADLDTAEATMDGNKAAIDAAVANAAQEKAQLSQAQVNLDYTTIVSPTDGVVISRSVDVGQTVAAALQAPTLFTIAQDLRKMQVDTNVAESDVGKLKDHMSATFSVDAYPSERFNGIVRQIRNAPTTLQNVVTYDAVLDVDNSELKLKPGMTANVTFVFAEKRDALRVPNSSLRFRPTPEVLAAFGVAAPVWAGHKHGDGGTAHAESGGQNAAADASGHAHGAGRGDGQSAQSDHRTVWVLREGKPVAEKVRVGVTDGTMTEIAEGNVNVGETVITDIASGPKSSAPGGQPPFRRGF